jgi:hypothetical protein
MMQVIRRANISSCMDIIICCISAPIHSSRTIQYYLKNNDAFFIDPFLTGQ